MQGKMLLLTYLFVSIHFQISLMALEMENSLSVFKSALKALNTAQADMTKSHHPFDCSVISYKI